MQETHCSYPHFYRNEGFAAAIRGHRAAPVKTQTVDVAGPGTQAGLEAIRGLAGRRNFTAVVAITDMVALGAYRGLQEAGLRIPEDVSVIGFDNTFFGEFLNPPLTTIDIPRDELSKAAVQMLLEGLGNGMSEMSIATRLVVRHSTGSPPKPKGRRGGLRGESKTR